MGGVGSGPRFKPGRQLKDAIAEVNIPKIVKNLEKWSQGKEVICPHCMERTGICVPETVALQSALELLNRRLGKVPQSVQLDITESIQLSADQVDLLIERYQIAMKATIPPSERLALSQGIDKALGEVVEGEVLNNGH